MLSTNTDAMAPATMPTIDAAGADDNSNSSADAEAADARARELAGLMARAITREFDRTLEQLIKLRNTRYARAIEELDNHESDALAREYEELQTAIHDIEATLPAKTRVTQHEIDVLSVSGAPDAQRDIAAKRAELKELQHRLPVMKQRMSEIQDCFQEINRQKRNVAKPVYEQWLKAVQPIVLAAEHGLFITLLGGLEKDLSLYQERTGTGRTGDHQGPSLHEGYLRGITAGARSPEYEAARHWYR
jgi:hypothetical protein